MEYTGLNRDHKLLFLVKKIPVNGRRFGKSYTGRFETEITGILMSRTLKMLNGTSAFYRTATMNI